MRRFTAIALLSAFLVAPTANADPAPAATAMAAPNIRASIASIRFDHDSSYLPPSAHYPSGAAPKVGAALALGFLGMLAGTWIGPKIENGHGADSGIKGAMIGASIGAVAGAIAGYKLAR